MQYSSFQDGRHGATTYFAMPNMQAAIDDIASGVTGNDSGATAASEHDENSNEVQKDGVATPQYQSPDNGVTAFSGGGDESDVTADNNSIAKGETQLKGQESSEQTKQATAVRAADTVADSGDDEAVTAASS